MSRSFYQQSMPRWIVWMRDKVWRPIRLVGGGWFLPMTALIALVCWGLGTFTPEAPQWLFVQGAFVAMFICLFGLARQILALQETMRPKFKVACRRDIPECKERANHLTMRCFYLRAIVESEAIDTLEARAFLTAITLDGKSRLNQTRQLTFDPGHGPEAHAKPMVPKVKYHLDVLLLNEDNSVLLGTIGRDKSTGPDGRNSFEFPGEYYLTIAIGLSGGGTDEVTFRFHWSGDHRHSFLEE
ncbi:MAG TPA: hypothetical protein VG734_02420 [Lacunisphaera sp.]|nr:hypothetical protein [Lacunisphaera sp.]